MFFNCFSPRFLYRYCGTFETHSHALITAITKFSSNLDDNLEESIGMKGLSNFSRLLLPRKQLGKVKKKSYEEYEKQFESDNSKIVVAEISSRRIVIFVS